MDFTSCDLTVFAKERAFSSLCVLLLRWTYTTIENSSGATKLQACLSNS